MWIEKIKIPCRYIKQWKSHFWSVYGDHGFTESYTDPTLAIERAMELYQSRKELEETKEILERW